MMRFVPQGRHRQTTLMLLPITVLAAVLGLYPIGQGIYLGFTNYRIGGVFGTVPLRYLGFANFEKIFADSDFTRGLLLIAIVGTIVIVVTYCLGYLQALVLSQKLPLRRVFRPPRLLPVAPPPPVGGCQVEEFLLPHPRAGKGLPLFLPLPAHAAVPPPCPTPSA